MFARVAAAGPQTTAPAGGPTSTPLPISAFYSPPAISDAALSPSGRYLAVLRRDPDVSAIIVYDTQTQSTQPILTNRNKDARFDWIWWKGDDRIIAGFSYFQGFDPFGGRILLDRRRLLVAVDRDGKNNVDLFEPDPKHPNFTGLHAQLIDGLNGDPDHILAAAPSPDGLAAVWRVDIHSGVAVKLETGDETTVAFRADHGGDVVARMLLRGNDLVIQGRSPGETRWSEVARLRPGDWKTLLDFEILGPTDHPAQFYVAVKPQSSDEGSARSVRVYDLQSHALGPPIWPTLKYDVDRIITDRDTDALMAVCYWVDAYQCDFKDPDLAANFRALSAFFHGDASIIPVSHSHDRQWWVLRVTGPTNPGTYYLYDWRKKSLLSLGLTRPQLPSEQLGPVERFSYSARDGTTIPGYLTRPSGAQSGPLPLVVMPHGGPEARDDYDFDTWAQVLATRGYLVFQPNFRGSGGYGEAYAEAGYGQWGGRMQDDLTDGVRALVASGRADPKRICIFGASYGGYAALMGGAMTPELYKCVVSWAGVSDLNRFLRFKRGGVFVGERSPAYDHFLKALGDPDKDKDRLARTSAVTYADHFAPPVLLIHGDADTNVPLEQSQVMERALKAAGHDVRIVVIKGENHTAWRPEHEQEAIGEVADFITAHIAPAVPAAAPPVAAKP